MGVLRNWRWCVAGGLAGGLLSLFVLTFIIGPRTGEASMSQRQGSTTTVATLPGGAGATTVPDDWDEDDYDDEAATATTTAPSTTAPPVSVPSGTGRPGGSTESPRTTAPSGAATDDPYVLPTFVGGEVISCVRRSPVTWEAFFRVTVTGGENWRFSEARDRPSETVTVRRSETIDPPADGSAAPKSHTIVLSEVSLLVGSKSPRTVSFHLTPPIEATC